MRSLLGVACGGALWLVSSGASGQAPPKARSSSLAWVRAEGAEACSGGKELAAAVEEILKRPVFVSASVADVAVEGHVERSGNGWKASLRIWDDHGALVGNRDLAAEGPDCHALDPSLAFVIAVTIDPDAAAPQPVPSPRPDPPAQPPPTAPVKPEVAPPGAGWRIVPALSVATTLGQLPSPAVGLSARVRIGPPAVGVELGGAGLLPQVKAVPGTAGATTTWSMAYGYAALCPSIASISHLSLLGCGGAGAGSLIVRPSGLVKAATVTETVVFAQVSARAEWRLPSVFFVGLGLTAAVPFSRTAYTVESVAGTEQSLFRPAPVAGAVDVAVGVVFE